SPLAGEGTIVCPRTRMGEGFSQQHTPHPSPRAAAPSCPLPQGHKGRGHNNGDRVRGSSLNRWPYSSLTMSNSTRLLIPAAHFCVRGLQLRFTHPEIEGWAERRETFGCSGTRWACT